ncbi:hypothetical protein PUMCH_001023 [Australozyma saopauloensis]|uniref:Ubiquitin-like domain-containing protein n=1 Tax=Australozyma saopauloensis TaxID=291208 RepID=A0AAX4H5C5_9ASCO|nr:hypothetical protein PUMCH_001023 [[Candida] saopauloensis]
MDTPFRLVIKKQTRGKIDHGLSETNEYSTRVTLNHTINHLLDQVLLNTVELDDIPEQGFSPFFQIAGREVTGLRHLYEILHLESPDSVVYSDQLELICDYRNPDRYGHRIPAPEFFDVEVVKAGPDGRHLLYCRETIVSTTSSIKEQAAEKLGLSADEVVLQYGNQVLKEDLALREVLNLDVPPLSSVQFSVQADGLSIDHHTNVSRADMRLNSEEFYVISANGSSVELSTMDCILNPEGYILLNKFAQEKLRRELNLQDIVESIPSSGINSPTPTRMADSNDANLPGNGAAQEIPPQEGAEQPVEEAYVNFNVDVDEGPNQDDAPRVVQNQSIFLLVLREISDNVDGLAQLVVRLAIASALIGPQRAFFILQPPLLFFVTAIIAWTSLFFYGNVISEWIDTSLLPNANHERIDYTFAKLISQIFRSAYGITTFMTDIAARGHNYLLAKLHYDRAESPRIRGMIGAATVAMFSVGEFLFVLLSTALPFLGSEVQKFCESQPRIEQLKMQKFIAKVLEKHPNSDEVKNQLIMGLSCHEIEPLLAPELPAAEYRDLARCYLNAIKMPLA